MHPYCIAAAAGNDADVQRRFQQHCMAVIVMLRMCEVHVCTSNRYLCNTIYAGTLKSIIYKYIQAIQVRDVRSRAGLNALVKRSNAYSCLRARGNSKASSKCEYKLLSTKVQRMKSRLSIGPRVE